MPQSCGSLISTIHNSLNISTCVASALSLTSTGVTLSPILKSLKRWRLPASKLCLLKSQLWWTGHISSMENYHLSRIILCSELSSGHCDWGAPKKQFKDYFKKSFGTYHSSWELWCLASHHQPYCLLLWKHPQDKRCRWRNCNIMPSNFDQTFCCSCSNHLYLSRIGFISHKQSSEDIDWSLLNLCFMKPNHVDDDESQPWLNVVRIVFNI